MDSLARVVAIDVAHHITQHGNRRQVIFTSDSERPVYMGLPREPAKTGENRGLRERFLRFSSA
jgi:hypothetical protein